MRLVSGSGAEGSATSTNEGNGPFGFYRWGGCVDMPPGGCRQVREVDEETFRQVGQETIEELPGRHLLVGQMADVHGGAVDEAYVEDGTPIAALTALVEMFGSCGKRCLTFRGHGVLKGGHAGANVLLIEGGQPCDRWKGGDGHV